MRGTCSCLYRNNNIYSVLDVASNHNNWDERLASLITTPVHNCSTRDVQPDALGTDCKTDTVRATRRTVKGNNKVLLRIYRGLSVLYVVSLEMLACYFTMSFLPPPAKARKGAPPGQRVCKIKQQSRGLQDPRQGPPWRIGKHELRTPSTQTYTAL